MGIVHHAHNEYYLKQVHRNNGLLDIPNKFVRRIDLDMYRTDTGFSLYFPPDNNTQECIGIPPDYLNFDRMDNKNLQNSCQLDNRDPNHCSISLLHTPSNLPSFCYLLLVSSVLACISSVHQFRSHNKHRVGRCSRLCYHVGLELWHLEYSRNRRRKVHLVILVLILHSIDLVKENTICFFIDNIISMLNSDRSTI